MKICIKCNREHHLNEFYKDNQKLSGYRSECKSCVNKHQKDYYQKNKERIILRNIKYAKDNAEYKKQYLKEYNIKNAEKIKEKQKNTYYNLGGKKRQTNRKLLNSYGITLEFYNQMLKDQNGVCFICEKVCKTGKALAVDHCHKTGTIRGLLCAACNRAIGNLKDDIKLLNKAIQYLTNISKYGVIHRHVEDEDQHE